MVTIHVRVWREVYEILRDVAEEHGLVLSNLVSSLLLGAIMNEAFSTWALCKIYGLKFNEAEAAAESMVERLAKLAEVLEEVEEVKVKVRAHA